MTGKTNSGLFTVPSTSGGDDNNEKTEGQKRKTCGWDSSMLKAHPYFTPIHTYKATESHTHRPKTRSFTIQFDADANLSRINNCARYGYAHTAFKSRTYASIKIRFRNNAIKIQFIIDCLAKRPKFTFPAIPD
jgi:hypothetical protein